MTVELYWLTLTLLLTALLWMPYILDRLAVRGVVPALADTAPERGGPHSVWAERLMRAHANAVENLAVMVPAVLVAHLLGVSTPATRAAAAVYFFARLIHAVVYAAGVPVARTLAFVVGWGAQIVFIASLLGWI